MISWDTFSYNMINLFLSSSNRHAYRNLPYEKGYGYKLMVIDFSDTIRNCIYDMSEGDQLVDDEDEILQSDEDSNDKDYKVDSSAMFDVLASLQHSDSNITTNMKM